MNLNFVDYNEILCQTIDNIVATRLLDIKFDNTIICTIIDNSNKDNGYYTVNNGSLTFEAYSDNANYLINLQVYVLIPQGDYSLQKTIINKYNTADNQVVEFTNPTDIVVPITKLCDIKASDGTETILYTGNNYTEGEEVIDHPYVRERVNGDIVLHTDPTNAFTRLIYSLKNLYLPIKNYDSLVIEADFFCNATAGGWEMGAGTYGLGVSILTANRAQIEQFTVDLDARKDMLGNPLQFLGGWFTLSVKSTGFKNLNPEDIITSIKVELYQNGGFKKVNGTGRGENMLSVGVRNVLIYLGKDISNMDMMTLPKLEISTNDYSAYTKSLSTRLLQASWYNLKNNSYEDISEIQSHLEWQQWAEDDWLTLSIPENQKITPTVLLDTLASQSRFRAIYKMGANTEEVIASNVLTFKNADTEWVLDETNAFLLIHKTNSLSSYPYYDENNQLQSNQLYKSRQIQVAFNPLFDENKNIVQGKTIEWRIPKKNSMLNINLAELTLKYELEDKQNFQILTEIDPNNTEYYILQGKWEDIKDKDGNIYNARNLFYSIKEFYNSNLINNTIECYIYYDNTHVKKVTLSFTFASKGIAGTGYTLTITPDNGLGWILSLANNNSNYLVKYEAKLFNPEGLEITTLVLLWNWKSHLNSDEFVGESNKNTFIIKKPINKTPSLPNTYHHNSLTVTITFNNIEFTKTIPIIWARNKYFTNIPTILSYDYAGNLIINITGELKLYDYKTNTAIKTEPENWYLYVFSSQAKNPDDRYSISGNGSISEIGNSKILEKISLYTPNLANENFIPSKTFSYEMSKYYFMVLSVHDSDGVKWSLPILVQFDAYASNVLNNWDGLLIIDEDENMILSAMMAAGAKDNENKFTGVLMGQIGKSDGITGSGLLGLKDGILTFNLSTSGQLTLGSPGLGLIQFDGKSGIIKSNSENGLSINLSTGVLKSSKFSLLANNNGNKIIIDNLDAQQPDFFHIGNTQEYIKFDKAGKLKIKVDELEITNGEAGVNLLNGTSVASMENMRKDGWGSIIISEPERAYILSINTFSEDNTAWASLSYDLNNIIHKIKNKKITLSGNIRLINNSDFKTANDLVTSNTVYPYLRFGCATTLSSPYNLPQFNQESCRTKISGVYEMAEFFGIEPPSLIMGASTSFSRTYTCPENVKYLSFLFGWVWPINSTKKNKLILLKISNLKLEIGENENPSWSPAPGDTMINDYFGLLNKALGIYMENGLLGINASYIKTGILSSANGNIKWNLNAKENEPNLILANNAPFVNNDNFGISDKGLIIYLLTDEQEKITKGIFTNELLLYETSNYNISGTTSSTVDYYYRTGTINSVLPYMPYRRWANPTAGVVGYLDPGTKVRLEVAESNKDNGTLIESLEYSGLGKGYCVRFANDSQKYFIAKYSTQLTVFPEVLPSRQDIINNKANVYELTSQTSAETYTGGILNLNSNNNSKMVIARNDRAAWLELTPNGIRCYHNSKVYSWP